MKKKILFAFITVCILILGFGVINASADTYGDLTYSVSQGRITITDCNSTVTSVEIPEKIGEYPVTSIGELAFERCSSLTSITIPDSVTSIGGYAFERCSSLTSITIPDGVTSIGRGAFERCSSLTSITIPDGVTSIGRGAFGDCSSLTNITIPDSVTSIGGYAFYGCSSLKDVHISDIAAWCNIQFQYEDSNPMYYADNLYLNENLITNLIIPDSVTSIGKYAFRGCSSITSITIPDSVTSVGQYAFEICGSLKNVHISDIAAWCNIEFSGGDSNPMYYADNLYLNGNLITNLIIPDGVTSIGSYAFEHCRSLISITIPDSVTSIGSSAFDGCSSLKNVHISDIAAWCNIEFQSEDSNPMYYDGNLYLNGNIITNLIIPDSVTSIGKYAFRGCSSLTSITIPDSVTSIGEATFRDCGSLTSITISDSVTSIGDYAFYHCSSLISITIPDSVTSIGDYAFCHCSNLTSITISDSVTSIGDYVFDGYNNVRKIYYSGSEEEWDAVVIGNGNNCLNNKDIITFDAIIPKTYIFVTNGGTAVSDIDGEITECPVTEKANNEFLGWYDNKELTGEPIAFPYSGTNTILYAKWKPIIYTKTSRVDVTPKYDVFKVSSTNTPIGCYIIFTCYSNNKLTYIEPRKYDGESPMYFVEGSNVDYDTVKVFVWEKLTNLKPLCESEMLKVN